MPRRSAVHPYFMPVAYATFKRVQFSIIIMVEGPTAKAYAIKIRNELSGEIIREVFTKRVYIPPDKLVGKRFLSSDSIGKNILLFVDDVAIRLHLMMYGSIHIYQLNEPLLKPKSQVRLLIRGAEKKLVAYNAPIVEIDKRDRILEKLRRDLGPDPLSDEWSREEALRNIMKFPEEKIGVIILDQSVIAGIGNILRNEILFRAKVNPEKKVMDLSRREVERIVSISEELSREFLKFKLERKRIKPLLLVYNRYRGKCRICGAPIKFYMQKPINRKTFICENCQKM